VSDFLGLDGSGFAFAGLVSEELDFEEFVILSLLEGDSDDFDLMPPNCWTVDADFNYESTVPPCLLAERRRRQLMSKMGMS